MPATITSLTGAIRERLEDFAENALDPQAAPAALLAVLARLETAPAEHSCRACETAHIMRGEIIRALAKELGIDDESGHDKTDLP